MITAKKVLKTNTIAFNNTFNKVPIRGLNAREQDLLMGLMAKMRGKGSEEILLSLPEVASLMGRDREHPSKTVEVANSLWAKVKETNYIDYIMRKPEPNEVKATLFSHFKALDDGVVVSLNPDLKYFLNDFNKGNYTAMKLNDFHGITNKHGKKLIRLISQYNSTNFFVIKKEDLMVLLGAPEGCSSSFFNERIVNPAINSITHLFSDLKVKQVKEKRKIVAYEFKFKRPIVVKVETPSKVKPIQDEIDKSAQSSQKEWHNEYMKPKTSKVSLPAERNATEVEFTNWLDKIGFFKANALYFRVDPVGKLTIKSVYKKLVLNDNGSIWSDVLFFAALDWVVKKNKTITYWNLVASFLEIMERAKHPGRSLKQNIDSIVYDFLPTEKANELEDFIDYGDVIDN